MGRAASARSQGPLQRPFVARSRSARLRSEWVPGRGQDRTHSLLARTRLAKAAGGVSRPVAACPPSFS
ncbi:hypothetical protein [Ruania rhizosphaerae]|uniref:hypothetical protein n=1 Tax=Ruania rhizosphaerae TaxID=1840413 RepID=UPI00135B50B2|nr:hypothetical protein [Ruania rhizosphaerae]